MTETDLHTGDSLKEHRELNSKESDDKQDKEAGLKRHVCFSSGVNRQKTLDRNLGHVKKISRLFGRYGKLANAS